VRRDRHRINTAVRYLPIGAKTAIDVLRSDDPRMPTPGVTERVITGNGLDLLPARECGQVCAHAGAGQRDLQRCAAEYGELFTTAAFDPALFSTVAMANAFAAPWLAADRLRMANRSTLWVFGLDWLVDYLATAQAEVEDIQQRCIAVADGTRAVPEDPLARFLADLREAVFASTSTPWLRRLWREQVHRTVRAMAREWVWKSTRHARVRAPSPTFDEYLANADNLGFCFVFVSHWIYTADADGARRPDEAGELLAAAEEVQRMLRLLNDLCTYDRDLKWNDLNAMMLGVTRAQVRYRLDELTGSCRALLRPLRRTHWQLAAFLERQIDFNLGFHPVTDYWGRG
jgi:hypothetical protein